MDEQRAQGLPSIDEEYQGPSWWHLSRLADVPHSPGMRRIALLGLVVQAIAMLTGILNVTWDWNGLPLRIASFEVGIPAPMPGTRITWISHM